MALSKTWEVLMKSRVNNDGKLSALNPQSWVAPFEAAALTERPDHLNGKKIGIIGQTHEPMLFLKDSLIAALPDIGDVTIFEAGAYSNRDGFSAAEKEEIDQMKPDVVIRGIAH